MKKTVYNLKKHRTLADKTQGEIAEILGVTRATYIKWEQDSGRGGHKMSTQSIDALSRALQVDVDELTADKSGQNVTQAQESDEFDRRLIMDYIEDLKRQRDEAKEELRELRKSYRSSK